jgi:hypothetical protein
MAGRVVSNRIGLTSAAIFQRVQFCDPDGNTSDRVFGAFLKSTCQNNTSRQGQLGVRLTF